MEMKCQTNTVQLGDIRMTGRQKATGKALPVKNSSKIKSTSLSSISALRTRSTLLVKLT